MQVDLDLIEGLVSGPTPQPSLGSQDIRTLVARCRKLEAVAEAARGWVDACVVVTGDKPQGAFAQQVVAALAALDKEETDNAPS